MNNPLNPANPPTPSSPGTHYNVSLVYFYGDGCEHCEKVRPLIENFGSDNPDLQVELLEVYHNLSNQQRYVELNNRFNISSPAIPEVFIGSTVLIGENDIRSSLGERIRIEKQRLATCNTSEPAPVPSSESCPPAVNLTPQMVLLPALADSLNPCALSVLIFLLISIAAAANRRRILLVGSSYIAAVFLFHLLVGIGIFSVVSFSGLAKVFSLAGASLAVILGAITLADVARNRETFLLSVPESGKGLLARYARIASLPAAFVLGVLAGLLGFSCTGGIYISILSLMGSTVSLAAGFPYLLLYNIIFILPLAVVTLLVAYGASPERADRWRVEHKKAIRLVIGAIMVVLGLVIFLGWFG